MAFRRTPSARRRPSNHISDGVYDRLRAQIRRLSRRSLRLESCEDRMMMAGTPKLVAIIPSEGSVIQEGSILNVAPNQLIVRLDDGQVVQATQLNLDTVKITGSNNVPIQNGFVGVGDNPNEVVVRFANPLPDDFFTLSISSIQTNGGSLSGATVHFRVDLGAQVVAVVPQPITRNAQGRLVQAVDTIDVYFNNDKLNPTNAQNPAYYQLIRTQDTATNADDGPAVNPLTATYDAAANKVTLKFRSNDLLGYSQTFRLRIGNSDPVPLAPPPALQVDDVEIVEGDTGTANALFTVRLSKESNRTVTVGYATESPLAGSVATPGIDYATVAGVLTFAPGVTTQTIAVPIAGDSIDEHSSSGSAAEKFVLRLSNATNALITRATATGSIIDDDGAPYVTIGNVTKLEGDGKTTPFVFTVRMLGVALQPVTVKYRTIDASAVSSVDFSAVSGALTFAPGQQEKSITVNVSGDTNLADDKQFYLLLSDASNATILGGVAVGTILNDD